MGRPSVAPWLSLKPVLRCAWLSLFRTGLACSGDLEPSHTPRSMQLPAQRLEPASSRPGAGPGGCPCGGGSFKEGLFSAEVISNSLLAVVLVQLSQRDPLPAGTHISFTLGFDVARGRSSLQEGTSQAEGPMNKGKGRGKSRENCHFLLSLRQSSPGPFQLETCLPQ